MDWNLRPGQASADCADVTDEHCAGEVWSGALWAVRSALGGRTADRLVLQSHFSLTVAADFEDAARALLAADSALYGGVHRALVGSILGARGLVDAERIDDTPADARPLGIPARVTGRLAFGSDEHDVYALRLEARHPIVIRLRSPRSDNDLRLLAPGSTSVGATPVAASELTGNDELHYTPPTTGRYFLDVRAIERSGEYVLETAADDLDGDGVGNRDDVCANVADPRQRDWDGDGRGDLCDRSARVVFAGVSRKGRRIRVRARMLPVTLPAKAFGLRLARRTCKHGHCRPRALRTRRAARARDGRVELRFKLPPGRYRLTAALKAKGYDSARSGTRSVLVRR